MSAINHSIAKTPLQQLPAVPAGILMSYLNGRPAWVRDAIIKSLLKVP